HATITLQEFYAYFAFELGDPLRDRGLGGVELLRRAAEAAERHHPHESLNCLEISHAPSGRRLIIIIYRIRLEKTIRHYHSHMREWMSTRMEAGTAMTSLARTETGSHDTADLSPSVAARHACRSGMANTTAGVANGFGQGNLVILPEKLAASFHRFCQLNPKPCPIIGMSDVGDPGIPALGIDLDIRTDLPR